MQQNLSEIEESASGSINFLNDIDKNFDSIRSSQCDPQLTLSLTTVETNIKEDSEDKKAQTPSPKEKKQKIQISRRKKQAINALTNYCELNGLVYKEKVKISCRMKESCENAFLAGQINEEPCEEICKGKCHIF